MYLFKPALGAALLLSLDLVHAGSGRQPFDWLDIASQFAEDFLYPSNGKIAASGDYAAFADDIRGRVDITTVFPGKELNVEYLFGLFTPADDWSTGATSLIPTPISSDLFSLSIQNNIVSLSNIFQMRYLKQNLTLPLAIDAWFRFDEDSRKMVQYDVTFRRWATFWKEAMPHLLPDIARENGVALDAKTDQEALVTLHAARHVCSEHQQWCGDYPQYDSYDECFEFLTTERSFGEPYELGMDNTGCRYMHTAMLRYRPEEHCVHVSRSGGGMCLERNYTDTVMSSPYADNFLAPVSNMPDDPDVDKLPEETQKELAKILMLSVSPTAVFWFPVFPLVLYVMIWASSLVARFFLLKSKAFRKLNVSTERTTTTYPVSILWTTIALVLQFVAAPSMFGYYSLLGIGAIRLAGVIIVALYTFELIYRHSIRPPLLIHHLLTIFSICFVVICVEVTSHPSLIATACIWLFQATLEQSVFLGLLAYRLEWDHTFTKACLRWGAVSSLVLKLATAVWLLILWGFKQSQYHETMDIVFDVVLWTVVPSLLVAQLWGASVTYKLTSRVGRLKGLSDTASIGSSEEGYNDQGRQRRDGDAEGDPLLGDQTHLEG